MPRRRQVGRVSKIGSTFPQILRQSRPNSRATKPNPLLAERLWLV
jgi:hypothetical protein